MVLYTRTYLLQFLNAKRLAWCGTNQNLAIRNAVGRIHLCYSSTASQNPSERMIGILKNKFPLAKKIEVVDVSGGCGSMYEVYVESVEFKGLTMVKQHRVINETLKEDIQQMHGIRILTKVPDENG